MLTTARAFLRGRFRPLRDRFDTHDLAQSAYVDAFRALPSFVPAERGSFRRWLAGILRNKLRHRAAYLTAKRRDARREAPLAGAAAGADSPSRRALRGEERARLAQALERLPARYADVIRWRFYDELALADVGARLGASEAAAQMLCRRALRKLRRAYEKTA